MNICDQVCQRETIGKYTIEIVVKDSQTWNKEGEMKYHRTNQIHEDQCIELIGEYVKP
jgi:hypothetical protein